MIGTSFGPYRIESLIGRGGMGEVYRAVDTSQDGRTVALKVLTPALSGDPQFAGRFRREAEIAARLSEPHVVPIHRYGELEGRLFLEMQLVDGRELADVVAQEGPLSPDRALAILEQVAGALDAAHADGLVHRDVKPSNILLTRPAAGRGEFVYLLDFGIARATEPGSRTALTRTGAVIGTLSYMAPERFLAHPAGPTADVYALACVLHEMLTGSRPFPGTGYAVQVAGHLHQPPPRPSALRPGLPTALDAVVARGMAKDPAARYPTAGELVRSARAALAGIEVGGVEGTAAAVPAGPRGAPTIIDEPAQPTWVPPIGQPPPWAPAGPPAGPPPVRRRWPLALGAAALAVAVLVTVLILNRPTEDVPIVAGPPAAAAAVDALPLSAPITERVMVGRAPDLGAPTVAELDGTPVLVVRAMSDITVLDMATGKPIGEQLHGLLLASAATATRIDGRSILIIGGVDRVIRIWDLATGEPLPTTMTGHTGSINTLAVTEVDGRKILLSGSDDQTVRRWDLATAAPLGDPLTGLPTRVGTMSVIRQDGRPVVLATDYQSPILAWDVESGASVGPPVPSVDSSITAVELPGGVAVLSRPDYLQVGFVDLRSGTPIGTSATEGSVLSTIAATVVAGRPLLVESRDAEIRVRDLRTGSPVGAPLTGHESSVSSLTPVTVGDVTYLVSTGSDRTIRIWDLTARARG